MLRAMIPMCLPCCSIAPVPVVPFVSLKRCMACGVSLRSDSDPRNWSRQKWTDGATGHFCHYYYDHTTGESLWESPVASLDSAVEMIQSFNVTRVPTDSVPPADVKLADKQHCQQQQRGLKCCQSDCLIQQCVQMPQVPAAQYSRALRP